jgi:hypothetical protein
MTYKYLILLSFISAFFIQKVNSQQNYIQGFAIGLPFAYGAGIGNIGFEHLNKSQTGSWQFTLNLSGGTLALDARIPVRKWITIDKIYLFNKKTDFRKAPFFSIFIEAGTRNESGGRLSEENGYLLKSTSSFELCPGLGVGKNFSIGKKWRFQVLAAPKLIVGFRKDHYKETPGNATFTHSYNEAIAGGRIMFNFCYPLGN